MGLVSDYRARPKPKVFGHEMTLTQKKVLRNTYLLLALSLLPTLIGTSIGFNLIASKSSMASFITGIPGVLFYLVVCIGLIFAIHAYKNSMLGLGLFFAFTFFMGVFLGPVLAFHLLKNPETGSKLIFISLFLTAGIFVGMSFLAHYVKVNTENLGSFLTKGLIVLLIVAVANIFLGVPVLAAVLSAAFLALFSLFVLYDTKQIIIGGETSYISAALGLFINIIMIFENILYLFSFFMGDE